ncbi:replication initiation protein RepC [Rhizobiaceae bacterium n13]|uniref:Replication initiation protein RepC n=1 Tax=Ferirhizobium litorale TaxID=2927786 RepID=A0AAE3U3T9_9HYPH|nr:plasmid replication protein RepC [Fererhizobium litorale]MDI7861990.1 replication initiation protein RepC [Fererhizobium litorale]MDI7922738.1 replication initiation protein RepC [Fererhizobium litorale]
MERLATTPFGGAPMRAQIFAHQARVERRQQALRDGKGGNDNGTADKWQLIRALTEAREAFGLSDRTITVLEALVSFHTDRVLDGSAPIIVFPSNAELSLRTRGMAPATVRRHIAQLVDVGLVLRRDSPNGKRFCRRDDRGQVEDAFGFDLAPLALAAAEVHAAADAARAEAKAIQKLRAEITILLRDMSKIIEAGLEERRAGDWIALAERLTALSGRVRRNADRESLEMRRGNLAELRREVEDLYLSGLSDEEMSGNDSDFGQHIQNSNTDLTSELNGYDLNNPAAAKAETKRAPETKSVSIGLKQFLAACPQLADYAKGGIRNWRDAIDAAAVVRSMLGISPDAWDKACTAMGETNAAITVAAILERAEEIRSPGGYLRNLTRKAEMGRFSVIPMIKALTG